MMCRTALTLILVIPITKKRLDIMIALWWLEWYQKLKISAEMINTLEAMKLSRDKCANNALYSDLNMTSTFILWNYNAINQPTNHIL